MALATRKNVYVVQFPETREIWSFGSGYGGNSLLGKKGHGASHWLCPCARRRLASRAHAADQNHNPGKKEIPRGGCISFSLRQDKPCDVAVLKCQVGKLKPWGDDIVWMAPNDKGKIRAINPENGLFGVAPGTGLSTNKVAVDSMREGAIFTNVATTKGRRTSGGRVLPD